MNISIPPIGLRPTHTHDQFYGPSVNMSPSPYDKTEKYRENIPNFWEKRLVTLLPSNMKDLRVKDFLDLGAAGYVFRLENSKTGQVSSVLKVMMSSIRFKTDEGPHLVS